MLVQHSRDDQLADESVRSISGRQFVRTTIALSREEMRIADAVLPDRLSVWWYISTPGDLAPIEGNFLGPRYGLLRLATPMLPGSQVLYKPRQPA